MRSDLYGSWRIWDITANLTTQTVKEISPFKDGNYVLSTDGSNASSYVASEARVKTQVITATGIETYTDVLGQRVSRMNETYLTGAGGERIIRTYRYYDGSNYLTSYIAYAPYGNGSADNAGRIVWQAHQDGTATTYVYDGSVGEQVKVTVDSGAATGAGDSTSPSVTSGSRTVTTYNKYWVAFDVARYDLGAPTTILNYWTAMLANQDIYGRPTHIEYNGNANDYETFTYGCCGPTEKRARNGAVTKMSSDLLKRAYATELKLSTSSAAITNYTSRAGLVTTTSIKGGSTITEFLVSKTTRNLLGQTTSRQSADADNGATELAETTIYATTYPSGGGTLSTVTNPLGKTRISETFRDGRTDSVSGTGALAMSYDYGVHATNGGGTWSKTIAANSNQWTQSYSDMIGRNIKTEYSDGAIASSNYNGSGTAAGSRGKLASSTDPDENANTGKGTTVSYAYNTEGERTTTTEAIADSQTRTTINDTFVVSDPDLGTAQKSTTTVNGKLISTSYRSADGYASKSVTLSGTSTSTRTVPNNGAWTVTSTTPDGQTTIQTYTNGRLQRTESFDNSSTPVSIAYTTYAHDALGRTLTTVDSRTGTTTVSSYTDAGAVTSVTTNGGNDTTSYTYDVMGRRLTTTLPDTTVTHTSYTNRGQTLATWGSQTYARLYQYDSLGRMSELRTYQNLTQGTEPTAATAGYASTEWLYDSQRGWLTEKNYNGETDNGTTDADYTYTESGRLKTRTWERGVTTTYGYV